MEFYHLTTLSRIRKILKEGLKVGKRKAFAAPFEATKSRIYLGRSPGEAYDQEPAGYPRMGLLKVSLPDDWPLHEDEYGLLYTDQEIPANYLSLEEMEPPQKKVWEKFLSELNLKDETETKD